MIFFLARSILMVLPKRFANSESDVLPLRLMMIEDWNEFGRAKSTLGKTGGMTLKLANAPTALSASTLNMGRTDQLPARASSEGIQRAQRNMKRDEERSAGHKKGTLADEPASVINQMRKPWTIVGLLAAGALCAAAVWYFLRGRKLEAR